MRVSRSVVLRAFVGDVLIALAKYAASFVSGSSAMLAEAIHSSSDSLNQFLLLFGYNLSEKSDKTKFPFGRGREQFFWSFVVALMVFAISGVLTFTEGFDKLHLIYTIKNPISVYLVFSVSLILDGYVLFISVSVFFKRFKEGGYESLRAFISDFRDPLLLTAMVEDIGAISGVVIAVTGVSLTYIYNNTVYDAVSSMMIGVVMMISGIYLAKESKDLLVGQGIPVSDQKKIESLLKTDDKINRVLDIRSVYQGPDSALLAMDLNFKDGMNTEEIENAVDDIEKNIRDKLPYITRIYIEAEEVKIRRK